MYFPSRAELQDWKKLSYYSPYKFASCVQRTFFFHNFSQTALAFTRKVIGRFERRVWSDWLPYIMHIIFRLRISAILKSFCFLNDMRCCCGFYFLDSYAFAEVIFVLWNGVYVVIRSIWRTVITVLKANGEIRSRWIEASQGTLCHKRAKCWAMIKCKW